MTTGLALAIAGAAIAIVGGGLGTILGTLSIASGGAGVVSENGKSFGAVLLLSALPSSQGIYGFLAAVLILLQTQLLGATSLADLPLITTETGWALLGAALPVGILGLVSGWGQGKVLQSGLRIVVKNPSDVGKTVILGVLMESMAVFGLLLSILIITSISIQ